MKRLLIALCCSAAFGVVPVQANTHREAPDMKKGAASAADMDAAASKAPGAQQNKMVTCQKEAGEHKLEGPARQAYVTDCLKAKPAAASAPSQGAKLGACSKEAAAKGLKGEERNKYLSECGKS